MELLKMITQEYLNRYEDEEKEMLILTYQSGAGAGVIKADLCEPVIDALAYINPEDNELKTEQIRFYWLAKESDRYGWIYNLKPYTIYKIKCRHIKDEYRNPKINKDVYFLASVVERDVSDSRLEKVLEKYQKPLYMDIPNLGKFEFDRRVEGYSKKVELLGERFDIILECSPENKENADVAGQNLEKILLNFEEWSNRIKAFAARQLTDLANDWAMDVGGEEITPQEFIGRMRMDTIVMRCDGGYVVSYFDDDMFGGHTITVEGKDIDSMDDAHI